MHAIELHARIDNHRLDISSEKLPKKGVAKVIVLVEEPSAATEPDAMSLFLAAQASFPKVDPAVLEEEFRQMREEWERPLW